MPTREKNRNSQRRFEEAWLTVTVSTAALIINSLSAFFTFLLVILIFCDDGWRFEQRIILDTEALRLFFSVHRENHSIHARRSRALSLTPAGTRTARPTGTAPEIPRYT